jgi:hypothetical protein
MFGRGSFPVFSLLKSCALRVLYSLGREFVRFWSWVVGVGGGGGKHKNRYLYDTVQYLHSCTST